MKPLTVHSAVETPQPQPGLSPRPIAEAERQRIASDLQNLGVGQVRFSRHDQMLYSTDASLYQVEPVGVVVPGSVEKISPIIAYCAATNVAVLPRGGGTSLAGQCTNHAIVIDVSPTCRKLISVDLERRQCVVEPGIGVDELNRKLDERKTGLFFAPDPATAAQASIGGCIGNNAAGARSIRYGRTSENVAGIEVVLSSAERLWLESGAGRNNPRALNLAEQVIAVVRKHARLIRERYPKTLRRNAGYGLDLILKQVEQGIGPEDLDLSGLICGSEGTLAMITAAKLKLHPVIRAKGLAIACFGNLEGAIGAVPTILTTGCCAVELIDDVVLQAARGNTECRQYMDLLLPVNGKPPAAVLYVEYQETGTMADVQARFESLRAVLTDTPINCLKDSGPMLRAWALRKAGEPLLHGLAGHRKPITVIEDNAVPVENLFKFVQGLKRIVAKHGTMAAYYAHASVGVLHVRPLLDVHDPADRERMRAIAVEVADLAKSCGGVMSGEHGDGRLRGPLLERYYGPEMLGVFRQIKAIFDSHGIFNPGNIVNPGPVESITELMRVRPKGADVRIPPVETYFSYDDQEGYGGAVEMCSGAGVCRKTATGSMCPSYRATLDERHSTRGRANALRLAISGQFATGGQAGPAWNDPDTLETLKLCLSCKACKTECPSNVDVARLKAEYLAQSYKQAGRTPLAARVFGHIRALGRLASAAPELVNWINTQPPVRALANKLLGLAPQRSIPAFAHSLYGWFNKRAQRPRIGQRPRVVLFADCFITYNEPHIGQSVVRILETLGYQVAMPQVGCCGRTLISTGLLDEAIKSADSVLSQLQPYIDDPNTRAIVICEPSCLSAMQDDYLQLKLAAPIELRRKLAAKAMMVEDFIDRFWAEHPIRPVESAAPGGPVLLHGHCHQKAVGSIESSAAILRRLVGQRLVVMPTGCCGMAGSFGYLADRYELSMQIGEMTLFPLVRSAPADAIILAPGTSCRHQIKDGTQREALHPIQLIERLLCASRAPAPVG